VSAENVPCNSRRGTTKELRKTLSFESQGMRVRRKVLKTTLVLREKFGGRKIMTLNTWAYKTARVDSSSGPVGSNILKEQKKKKVSF